MITSSENEAVTVLERSGKPSGDELPAGPGKMGRIWTRRNLTVDSLTHQ